MDSFLQTAELHRTYRTEYETVLTFQVKQRAKYNNTKRIVVLSQISEIKN